MRHYEALGVSPPWGVVVDNCYHVKACIHKAIGTAKVLLDVFHFIGRLVTVDLIQLYRITHYL